ncbi:hypothetical protein [Comamonas sp. GB3 AK4-5]|uniref:hypothetical protein n=1 Tax=Comamonas sp. GB3 AK4-5 TaxID=3231487 RepID=UPI00351E2ECE
MKTGDFAVGAPWRALDSFSHRWLEGADSLDAVLATLESLRAAEPGMGFLCTLDDVAQCRYTSGHARQDDRLYLAYDDAPDEATEDRLQLEHTMRQLQHPEWAQDWAAVCGSLLVLEEDVLALLAANRAPQRLLDEVVYIQRLPVPRDDLLLAGMPNGYFSADWDVFQNHAVLHHLTMQHGYRFFGIGASWLGLVRATPPDAEQARALVQDLRQLYGQGRDAVLQHPGWDALVAVLQARRTLLLGYTEGMAESLGCSAAA